MRESPVPTSGMSAQRRILLIANTGWYLRNFRASLVQRFERLGMAVTLAAPSGADTQSSFFKERRFEPLNFKRQGRNPFIELMAILRFVRLFRRVNPEIVLTWTPKPNVYGCIAGRFLRVRVIPNVSGLGAVFIRGGWLTRLMGQLYRFAFARARTVFFQNEEDLSNFISAGWVTAAQAQRLPGSGVDLSHFEPQPLPPRDPFVFLYIGRLLTDKGLRELVEATEDLHRNGHRFVLRLAGFLDPGNPAALAKQELELWISSGVVDYLGSLVDVRPALAAAHCVVLPSYREGVPRSLLEAAATARPLIAANVPGCRDAVVDGQTGLLCEPKSAKSLAGCMLRMLDSEPEFLAEMGRAGRSHVERFFPEEQVLDAYVRCCETLWALPHSGRKLACKE